MLNKKCQTAYIDPEQEELLKGMNVKGTQNFEEDVQKAEQNYEEILLHLHEVLNPDQIDII